MTTKLKFAAGRNIAMKVPPHVYETTIQFYRDVLGLKAITKHAPSVDFEFGSNNLWIDRVPGISQAETWLEVATNDIAAASSISRRQVLCAATRSSNYRKGFKHSGYQAQHQSFTSSAKTVSHGRRCI